MHETLQCSYLRMEKVKINQSSTVFAILLVIGTLIAYQARYILLISVIGIGVGVLLVPVLRFFRNRVHLPKFLSAMLVFICIVTLLALVGGSIYFLVSDQVNLLADRWPEITGGIESWLIDISNKYPWMKGQIENFEAGTYIKNSLFRIFKGFQVGLIALSGLAFTIVIGLYTAVGGNDYYNSLVEAFPNPKRTKVAKVLRECAVVLRGWFKAQLIDMGIIGSITGIGLWIVGVEYWAVFALLTAVLGIIPYIGIFFVVIAATIITLASNPSKLPWMLGVFFITQQLEGNLILPLVLKGRAELPVVPLLIFMMFLGTFFGIMGVFIAPPLFAVLRTLYIELYLPRVNSAIKA